MPLPQLFSYSKTPVGLVTIEHRCNMQPWDIDSITTYSCLNPFMCLESNPPASCTTNPPYKLYLRGTRGKQAETQAELHSLQHLAV